ncbi:MAG: hypothetical protein KJ601_02155 [Nanoarchaeota archaeon]|nr:hypothetical protein [Nanoarchaeota archaeon]MBU1704603.1 hypothetical protein [Nanoarchaeota archaeon]
MVKTIPWSDLNEPIANVRYKGVWDMQDLYESMVDWFMRKKFKFYEKIYKHKHPSPFGIERQYTWEAIRKENDYVQTKYGIYMHLYDAADVDVVLPSGDKKTYTKGRIWIELKVGIVSDYEGRFSEKQFYSHLKDFYNKYVIRKNFTEGWGPKNRYEMYELKALIERKLKMEADEYEHAHFAGVHKRY